jgi:glycosyltransferase involved in cell wall biosynthesis
MTKRILLVSHYSKDPGPIDKFYEYFIHRYNVIVFKYPLYLDGSVKNSLEIDRKKTLFSLPSFLQYLLEGVVMTIRYLHAQRRKAPIDLAIVLDPLCYWHVYIFRWFLKVKKIAFYNTDYSKRRFANPGLNRLYIFLFHFTYRKADYFFYLTKAALKDLTSFIGRRKNNYYITHTVDLKHINDSEKKYPHSIVFAGSISYSVDFYPFLQALSKLKKNSIQFTLHIYGQDRSNGELRKLIKQYNLTHDILLKGPVANKTLVEDILPRYQIGIAPYKIVFDNESPDHRYLGSELTAKIVEYIGVGLPVITTRIVPAFDVLRKRNIGYLASTSEDWYRALVALLTDKTLYTTMSGNAKAYGKKYDQETVFSNIFKEIL